MKFFSKTISFIISIVFTQQLLIAQTCPSITAMAGAATNTTICQGQCANLTASLTPVKATTSYSVGSISYSPYPFSGGAPAMGNIDDVWSPAINIGFNFCYFGNTFNQLLVGSNGEITFDISKANSFENYAINAILPNTLEHPVNTICVAYRDINPAIGATSTISTYTTGVAPCRKFVAYWSNIPMFSCTGQTSTFQIVLHESTNIIETFITNSTACMSWQSGRGLMGIQDGTGTTAVAPAGRNVLTPWTAINEAWRYTPTGVNTFTVNWSGPGGFTATGLTATPCPTATSNYTATMNVLNCNGTTNTFTSAIQVSVTPTPTTPIVATPTAICRGASATLSSSGATSYTWMPGGATTASISVSPTVTTTYTLTRQVGSCTSTQTISIIVRPTPTITATSNPTILCGGGSATLTANGASTYTWMPGGATGNSTVVSPTATTVYTVTGTNTLGCTGTRTLNLTVAPNPTINILSSSIGSICPGSTVALAATGANTYTWMPGSLTGSNVVVSPTINTTYTVTGRNTAGCSATKTIAISVLPSITLTPVASPTIICRGNSSTLTVTGANSYTWMPGTLTGSNVVVSPTVNTTYTVTGTNISGCTKSTTLSVQVSTVNVTATSNPTILCSGNSATLTANGASTYTWMPGGATGNSTVVTPTATTIYTVTGTNTLGCTGTRTLNLTVAPNPTINILSSSIGSICPGSTVTLAATGANTYTWMPGSLTGSNVVVSPTVNTTYTVTGRNTAGCSATKTIAISVLPSITLTPVASPTIICRGNSSTLTVTGANSYTWMPGTLTGSNVVVSPTVNTTYTVTGTNISGCTKSTTLSVQVSTVNVTATSNPTILCSGNSATLTANGASTYTWMPGGATGNSTVVSPTATTVYTVTGTNTLGCTGTRTLNLTVAPNPTINILSSSIGSICPGSTVALAATGANTYTWMPGSLTGSNVVVSPTINTTYTVTGRNTAGCSATKTIAISVLPSITLTPVASPTIICRGNSSTLTVTGANTYTWMPGTLTGSNVVVSPTVNTTYTVTGTSISGCTKSTTLSVQVSTVNVTATSNPTILCSGNSATLTANGASTYTWMPGGATGNSTVVTPTATTIYTVIGTNTLGCTGTRTLNLTVAPNPTVNVSATSTTICPGTTTTLTAIGATTYTWMPGSLTGSNVVVSPTINTTYTVTGRNTAGCSATKTIAISVLPSITLTPIASPSVICSGNSSTLTVTGTNTYTWMPGTLTGSNVVVSPTVNTTYTVTGTNISGCTKSTTLSVQVSTVNVTATSNPTILCSGNSATITANGASTYTWMPGGANGNSTVVSPTATTIYTVTGTNTLGCTSTKTINLVVNTTPTLIANPTSTSICAGETLTLTVNGADTYTWMPGAISGTSAVVSPTANTTYTIQGKTLAGCISNTTIPVVVNPLPVITTSNTPFILCTGSTATLTATGAATYTWIPGNMTGSVVTVNPLSTTIYTVTGASAANCISTATVNLKVTSTPTISIIATPTMICSGSTATLSGSGALTYTWNPGNLNTSSVTVTPTTTTTYTLTGDNGFGCLDSKTITITVNPTPTISASASPTLICSGNSSSLTASGANTYTWMPGSLTGSLVTVSPSSNTTYTVIGEDVLGCISSETINIVLANSTLSVSSTSSAVCAGNSTTLTASGSTSYTWNPGGITSSTIVVTPSVTTTYSVSATNTIGCTDIQTIAITVNSIPTLSLSANPTSICSGNPSILTATGATSYTWMPGNLNTSTISVTPTVATVYTVTGEDNGCVGTNTLAINISTTPTISTSAVSNSICAGVSTTLSATGATSYTWSPGNFTGSNVTVTPSVTTTYTVTGDNGSGCTGTETITINVNTAPSLSITTSASTICIGGTVSLVASGASTYTWMPSSATTTSITETPTVTTTYTVIGENTTGCVSSQSITITVNPIPSLTLSVNPSTICLGTTATLTAAGAVSYSWSPGGLTGSTITDSPSSTTTYTVTGDNVACSTTETITLSVATSTTTLSVSATPTLMCAGSTVSLTASGATNYTWMPTNTNGSTITDNPSTATTYTVLGDDGVCVTSSTVFVDITPGPSGVTANSNGTITCSTLTVSLSGNTTSTASVTYNWNGPLSYTSSVQNPSDITADGIYTLTVTDNNTGCSSTETVAVISNTIVPSISTPTPSPMLGCNTSVTLSITTPSASTYSYSWSGPSSYTAAVQNPTTNIAGDYTVSVTDLANGCSNSATLSVGVNTNTPVFTASIVPATCTGSVANNDGTILISGNASSDTYDLSQATTYTGSATYASANAIPVTGIITNTLANPTVTTAYTLRIFSINGCYKDTTLYLTSTSCTVSVINSSLGVTKAVGTPTLINNNTYQVTYTVVAFNNSTTDITNFSLIDSLTNTFPLPTSYTVAAPPMMTSSNSSLTINTLFDGVTNNDLLIPATSTLIAGRKDTVVFTVQVNPNGLFTPFSNTAFGTGVLTGTVVADSSNTGFAWDPDGDGNPTNNNIPTVINLTPHSAIGVAKEGGVSVIIEDKTIDVTYNIIVTNLGNDTLTSVQVVDSIRLQAPAQYMIKSGPTASGNLVANPNYNGSTDINLLVAGSSKLAPGESQSINFVLNITPNDVKSITNIALGNGVGTNGIVRDSSNNGQIADPNGNGDATEPGENVPTVLELPDVNLFIPEVFTPDGDGKNDFFVMKGIVGRTVKLTVFNRWGSKVYENNNYDNTWNGTANVSSLLLGNSKLPQGTYYYIVEFEDGLDKPIHGYVVLQY